MKTKLAGMGGAPAQTFVDDVFSAWLYTGNGSTQTITNGIDLAGKGGMVWSKCRSNGGVGTNEIHTLMDTTRGAGYRISSELTGAQVYNSNSITAFSSSGFSIGSSPINNTPSYTYASWTFRKAAKFFDVVTLSYTSGQAVFNHNLGVAPGMVILKVYNGYSDNWHVYHRSLGNNQSMHLNTTDAAFGSSPRFSATDTTFTVVSTGLFGASSIVAYLFAHDTSSTGIIQCGSYTGNGSATGPTVSLGWEPQYWMVKRASGGTGKWVVIDSMRGFVNSTSATPSDAYLSPNLSDAESTWGDFTGSENAAIPLATGFQIVSSAAPINNSGDTYIYMAIRRPNKPPTSGTQVYAPITRTGTGATGTSTAFGQVTDLVFTKQRSSTQTWAWTDRLRGATKELTSASAVIEATYANDVTGFDTMTGFTFGSGVSGQVNTSATTYVDNLFRRAPGFFDVICYTGAGSAPFTTYHNLTVVPTFMIFKSRTDATENWFVEMPSIGVGLELNNTSANHSSNIPVPTANTITANDTRFFLTGKTYVAYLFATLAGISKVGSYTGNGTGQAIACGFSAGARFVLIKRYDSIGAWYTFDSARGLTSGSSPYLLLNSTAAETTGDNGVYQSTGGFTLGSTASTTTNINGASYIYLSVA